MEKFQKGIFSRDVLSPLLFVIAMMPLNCIPRKYAGGYKFTKSQENMNMDDIKLFVKMEKELETLIQTIRIYSRYIGLEFSIEKCAMLIMKSGKGQITKGIE